MKKLFVLSAFVLLISCAAPSTNIPTGTIRIYELDNQLIVVEYQKPDSTTGRLYLRKDRRNLNQRIRMLVGEAYKRMGEE